MPSPRVTCSASRGLPGIAGAKRTADLVPLCHPIALDVVEVDVEADAELPGVRIQARTRATARTGVEMEALAAVMAACLTVYDMVKAVDRCDAYRGRAAAVEDRRNPWRLDRAAR